MHPHTLYQAHPLWMKYPCLTSLAPALWYPFRKKKWEVITADDLENASPQIREGDIVIVNTGWHKYYGDNQHYFGF